MCGIVGIIGDPSVTVARVAAMAATIAHRGPDDHGAEIWPDHGVGLGHRRLSIIDLSPLGRNPMPNEDRQVWVVYNGEIYNHAALRAELERLGHIFRSQTDTEVLVHAYEEWGDAHVHRLRGMFAYAIYDRRRVHAAARVLLVRDRLGIKPLVYAQSGGVLAFASEIKALLTEARVGSRIDRSALFDYLTYLYVPGSKTAYADIRKLPPGHLAVWEEGRLNVQEYWDVDFSRPAPVRSAEAAIEMTRDRIHDAVTSHLVSDVPIGVFLSGGVDSSTVAAEVARTSAGPIATFSIGFDVEAHSEIRYARIVAEHVHAQHTEKVVAAESARQGASRVLSLYDEPFADTSAIPTEALARLTGMSVKVALSGDGGDEVFGGYGWYAAWQRRMYVDAIPLWARAPLLRPVQRRWPSRVRGRKLVRDLVSTPLGRYARLMELFSPAEKRSLLPPDWRAEFRDYDDYWHWRRYWRDELDPLTRLQYLDLKTFLPDDILTKVDRASMAASLEVRPPLLDHELVEAIFSIPVEWRRRGHESKPLLKAAARGLVPPSIVDRPKRGFSAPMTAWVDASRQWIEADLRRAASDGVLAAGIDRAPWLFERGAKAWGAVLLHRWLSDGSRREAEARAV